MANPRVAPQYLNMPGVAALHPTNWMRARAHEESRGYWKHAPMIAVLMLATVAIRYQELWPPLRFLKPTFTIGIFGVGYLIARTKNRARNAALKYLPLKLVIAYLIWIVIGVPFALWPGRAWVEAQTLIPNVILVGTLVLCAPTKEVSDKVTWYYYLMVLASATLAFILQRGEGGRLEIGGTYDTNDSAALFATAVPFALGFVSRSKGKRRWAGVGGVVLLTMAIVATGSRGGIIALVAGCFVFGWGFKASKRIGMIIGMVVLALVGWTFTGQAFRERMSTLLEIRDDYNFQIAEGRIAIWTRGVGYAIERPVLGVGPGNFPYRDGQWKAQHGLGGKWSAAHNAFVQAFVDLGIPGGTLFVVILGVAGKRAYEHWRPRRSRQRNGYHRPEYLASLVTMIVASIFLSNAYSQILFGLLGLLALADRARRADDRGRRTWRQTVAAAQAQPQIAQYGVAVPFNEGLGRPPNA